MGIIITKGTLFIDIDGTIVHTDTEEPLPQAVEKINKAYDEGYVIVLTTLRGSNWAVAHPYSKINTERTLKSIGLKWHEIIWDSPSPRIIINDDTVLALQHQSNKDWNDIHL